MVGAMLITLLRHADRIKIACLAQLVNVIAPIMTENGGRIWKQTIYYPYLHASLYGRGTAMNVIIDAPKYDTKNFTDVSALDAVAVESEVEKYLTLFLLNRGTETLELSCNLRDYPGAHVEEMITMNCDDLKMINNADYPDRVVPKGSSDYVLDDNNLTAKLMPYSWNVVRIQVKKGFWM